MKFGCHNSFPPLLAAAFLTGCSSDTTTNNSHSDKTTNNPAPANATFTPINLQPKANQPLNRPAKPGGRGNQLADLPRGRQSLAGVPFEIGESYIHLGGKGLRGKPLAVNGIPVNQTVHRLHFLHATSNSGIHKRDGSGQRDGELIALYLVHYEDGTTADVPVIYGEHLRDWWNWDNSKPVTNAKVAWEGENTYAQRNGVTIRLYSSSWENPHPQKKVATIDFQSANSLSGPFCVAVTAER